jgi:pyrroloquinoline-quinone synthase
MSFHDRLLSVMERKDHWAWPHFAGPAATRPQLLIHYQQEWLTYVRDFPQLLGRLHGSCPDPAARRLLAENLYEEETGGLSRTGPHPELFLRMMEGLGFARRLFERAAPLSASARYRRWLDRATRREPWVVGAAVVTIFVEGSRHEREALDGARRGVVRAFDPRQDPLVRHHGVDPSFLVLKAAHAAVEDGHRGAAWEIVERHARGPAARAAVLRAMERSLALWLGFREGVARAAGLVPPGGVR